MQEIDIDSVIVDFQDDEYSEDVDFVLDDFFNTLGITNSKDIPALKDASFQVRSVLNNYLSSGNHTLRLNKLKNFYKCLDWIPFKDMDKSFLSKFTDSEQKILLKEIQVYLNKKDEKLNQKSQWRKEYRQRLWNYYKERIPGNIKLELEELRDYELNMVGHDRNWQYYFNFSSFKKIDEFVSLSSYDKVNLYEQFKKDVLSYKTNRDKNLYEDSFSEHTCDNWEDEILGSINWEHKKHSGESDSCKPQSDDPLLDFATLELPFGASKDLIKRQYRRLAKIYHPDAPDGDESRMKAIICAYQRLINA